MPRALWRRRAVTQTPRPSDRPRWRGRLRRSGGRFARRVLRVSHRPGHGYPGGHLGAHPPREYRMPPAPPPAPPPASALASPPAPVPQSAPASPVSEASAPAPATAAPVPPADGRPAGAPAAAAEVAPEGGAVLTGPRTARRQAWFALVNTCTLASLVLGFTAVLLATGGEVAAAAVCLLVCVVLDGIDGALARRLRVSTPFGAQLDSLADMTAFGLAAPVVVFAHLAGAAPPAAAAAACALVGGCAALRLARFNVSSKDSRYFTGVPTTMMAGTIAVTVLVAPPLSPPVLLAGVVLGALAMVSSFPYASLGRLLRLPPWLVLAPLAAAVVDPRMTVVLLVVAYLASGPVLWLHRRRTAPVLAVSATGRSA